MVRKLIAALVLLMFLLTGTALADEQVIDDANLFSANDIVRLTDIINRIETRHDVDIVVLTTYNTPDDYSDSMIRIRNYADDYYDQHGYGMGPDDSGLLFLIDMNNRVMWISTGGVMIDYITDAREEEIFDAAEYGMRSGNYGQAAAAAMDMVSRQMDQGRQEGTFRYDEATGKRIGGIYNALTGAETLIALIAGVAAALVMFLSVKGGYDLKGSTYSYDVNANASIAMTKDSEQFLRRTVSRTARVTSSGGGSGHSGGGRSGGSGVHRSSGGVSHGGGGRRF